MPNLYYRISDPSDLRDLGDLYSSWVAAGNPKAQEWSEAPAQPEGGVWQDGAWVVLANELDPIAAAEAHIAKFFSSLILMDGLQKLFTRDPATLPKTVAVNAWVESVKSAALAGSTEFTEPPHTAEEVVAE